MHLTNECSKLLTERHLKAKTKKEKPQILDEYCCDAAQARTVCYAEVIQQLLPASDEPSYQEAVYRQG